jgi:hypothetical protein
MIIPLVVMLIDNKNPPHLPAEKLAHAKAPVGVKGKMFVACCDGLFHGPRAMSIGFYASCQDTASNSPQPQPQ